MLSLTQQRRLEAKTMWLEKRILVPTDFSDPAREAARVGVELAQRYGVPLTLLHVFGVGNQAYVGLDLNLTKDFVRSAESAARHALNEEAAALANQGVTISAVLNTGMPWEQILTTAQMTGADLIIMGTHGRRGVARAVLGSVAERVVRLSPIPVLTVR
jgi:nucleotide-binding universal stress UspA family protein